MKIQATLILGEQFRTFELKGRKGWAMANLAYVGAKGITTIERPAPRWSGYIFDLRELGIPIETQMEPHDGNYPGHHARYRLACDAQIEVLGQEVQQ